MPSLPRRRTVIGTVLLAGVLAGAAGCTGPAKPRAARPVAVTIGVLAPSSGPGAGAGRDAVQGAQLAVEVVNNAHADVALPLASGTGVLGGAPIELAVVDSGGDPEVAEERALELARDKHPAGIVGADTAPVVAAVSQQTERQAVPFVDAISSAGYLTDFGLDWYFRTGPDDRRLAEATVALIHQEEPARSARRVVVLAGVAEQTASTVTTLAEVAQAGGFTMGDILTVNPSLDLSLVAEKVAAGRPDVVVAVVTTVAEAEAVSEISHRMRTPVPLIAFGHGLVGLTGSTSGAHGVLRTAAWSGDFAGRNPVARAVADLYERRFGAAMTDTAASAFTATLTLALAVNTAGAVDGPRIRAALRQMSLPATQMIMPWDGLQFDTRGQNTLAAAVVEQHVPNGFQVVYPRELASAEVAWPGSGR